jgi:hypothetical protein
MKEITVILTIWKRNNLEKQLLSILNQTLKPKEIIVYQNESHVDIKSIINKYNLTHIQSNKNYKFHGRFTVPLLLDTEYCIVYDDDTISNKKWFENCIRINSDKNCIVGGNGRTLASTYLNGKMYSRASGAGMSEPEDLKVDFVGHCWFFKTEWIKYMWKEKTFSFDNGEDIQLCASSKIYGGIDSYVPMMPENDKELWGDIEQNKLGTDQHATYKRQKNHNSLRQQIIKYWIDKGWRPLFMGNS